MKTFAAALFAASASAELMTSVDYAFMSFVSSFNKMYATAEEFAVRKEHYAAISEAIDAINSNPASTHVAGHNEFSDWTPLEKEQLLGHIPMPAIDKAVVVQDVEFNGANDIDWRSLGMIGAIKNQGKCGSCWAFSAIGAIEAAWSIKNGLLSQPMSEQELVDCSSSAGNFGCSGGAAPWAYDWLAKKATMKEKNYPYTAKKGTCNYNKKKKVANVESYVWPQGTPAILNQINVAPVSTVFSAGNDVMSTYKSGIITETSGCGVLQDHGGVLVGYGSENGVQYYIVRNSWGTNWGEEGYVRIATNGGGSTGVCGINDYNLGPVVVSAK